MFKLLGNSAYGKLIETVERKTRIIYTKDQEKVDRAKWPVWFDDMEEIGDAFEIKFRKEKVTITAPSKSELWCISWLNCVVEQKSFWHSTPQKLAVVIKCSSKFDHFVPRCFSNSF